MTRTDRRGLPAAASGTRRYPAEPVSEPNSESFRIAGDTLHRGGGRFRPPPTRGPSEVLHELIERIHHGCPRFSRQMGVDLSRSRTAMPEVLVDDAEIHPRFQQMRRIRIAKRMNVGAWRYLRRRRRA